MPLPTSTIFKHRPQPRRIRRTYSPRDQREDFVEDSLQDCPELFGALFVHGLDGMAIADPDGRFVKVNPALCSLLGYRESELLGLHLQSIMAPSQWHRLSASMAEILSGSASVAQFAFECRHRCGKPLQGQLNLCCITAPSGEVRLLVVQIQAIGHPTRAENGLVESRQWYRALTDATFEAVFVSKEGIGIDANQTAATMFDYPREELIGIFGANIIAPEYRTRFWRDILSDDETPYHAVALKRDGTRFHVMIQGKIVRIGDSEVRVTVLRDIDAQVKAEAALRESERHLRSLMESASNFALFRLRHRPENPSRPQIVFISPSIAEIVAPPTVSDVQAWLEMIHPDDAPRLSEGGRKILQAYRLDERVRIRDRAGKGWRWLRIISAVVADQTDDSLFFNGIILDITGEVEAASALKAREKDLKERTDSLSEVNTALEVLLGKREVDRLEVEEKMLSNARNLILPYLEKLKSSRLDDRQRVYLNLVESNLNELISPLSRRMSRHYLNFTPLEIQVANMVKEGRTTKDIALILGLSIRTIEAVRYAIRRKLGLKKKCSNLRSFLLSADGTDTAPGGDGWSS